ncbi:MAG TPA: cupredoxin family copper-binding protein [Ktedonobacteraceae bacterium]|nr:cupredoxin family copper-binding protein [Ktedonobacteraceae bacterium]
MFQGKRLTMIIKASCGLLALSLLIVLAACGGGSSATSVASTPTTAPTTAPTATPTTEPPTATPTASTAGDGSSVAIASLAFSPTSLTVKVGTKVTWTNNDTVAHTVTSDQGAFDSGTLAVGQSFSFTFTKAGTYHYHCDIHPFMKATITVQ